MILFLPYIKKIPHLNKHEQEISFFYLLRLVEIIKRVCSSFSTRKFYAHVLCTHHKNSIKQIHEKKFVGSSTRAIFNILYASPSNFSLWIFFFTFYCTNRKKFFLVAVFAIALIHWQHNFNIVEHTILHTHIYFIVGE